MSRSRTRGRRTRSRRWCTSSAKSHRRHHEDPTEPDLIFIRPTAVVPSTGAAGRARRRPRLQRLGALGPARPLRRQHHLGTEPGRPVPRPGDRRVACRGGGPAARRAPAWGRVAWLAALVVGAASLAAVLVSVYVDIGRVGIVPSLYEPIWTTEKAWSAVAEGTAAGLAALRLTLPLVGRQARLGLSSSRSPAASARPLPSRPGLGRIEGVREVVVGTDRFPPRLHDADEVHRTLAISTPPRPPIPAARLGPVAS